MPATTLAKLPAEVRADLPAFSASLLERYMDGESVVEIAQSLGVSTARVYLILIEHSEDGWKSSQVAMALKRLDEAKAGIDSARDQVDIARARESARIAQWDLERVCRRVYGQDAMPVLGQGMVQINIDLGERKRAIEQSPDGGADGE